MIGEIEAFFDQGIDIDKPVFTRAFARVQQHVLDDGIRTLAVLHDLVEVALQRIGIISVISARSLVRRGWASSEACLQFIDKLGRNRREIIDEIERVFDLVRDASGELTERGELLRLDEAVLRVYANPPARRPVRVYGPQHCSNSRTFSIAMAAWSANVVTSSICLSVKASTFLRDNARTPIGTPSRNIGTPITVRKSPKSNPGENVYSGST